MNTEPKEHEHCLRCGRKLKNPDARRLGYGAVCYKKMQTSGKRLFNECGIREGNDIQDISSGRGEQ